MLLKSFFICFFLKNLINLFFFLFVLNYIKSILNKLLLLSFWWFFFLRGWQWKKGKLFFFVLLQIFMYILFFLTVIYDWIIFLNIKKYKRKKKPHRNMQILIVPFKKKEWKLNEKSLSWLFKFCILCKLIKFTENITIEV